MRRKTIEVLERELQEAGHDVERDYVMGELETYDGDGWVFRVDGEVVASAASIGALEERLEAWLGSRVKWGMKGVVLSLQRAYCKGRM